MNTIRRRITSERNDGICGKLRTIGFDVEADVFQNMAQRESATDERARAVQRERDSVADDLVKAQRTITHLIAALVVSNLTLIGIIILS